MWASVGRTLELCESLWAENLQKAPDSHPGERPAISSSCSGVRTRTTYRAELLEAFCGRRIALDG